MQSELTYPALLKTDGQIIKTLPEDRLHYSLKELYRWLECDLVEIIHLEDIGWTIIIDEEGKLKDYEINHNATFYFRKYKSQLHNPTDFIAGHAIICPNHMFV